MFWQACTICGHAPYPGRPPDRLPSMSEHDPELDQHFPEITRRLRAFGSAPVASVVADRTLARLRAAGRPRLSGTRLKLLSAAAIAGFAAGGVGLAAADVLPAPVQDVAHNALDAVGVHVPPGHNRYNDPTVCPGGPYRNHGAYVRAHPNDPNAGASPCGKPVQSVNPTGKPNADKNDPTDKNDPADKNDKNKAHGPPPWAHGHGKPDTQDPATGPDPTTKPAKPSPASTAPMTTTSRPPSTTTSSSSTSSTTSTTTRP